MYKLSLFGSPKVERDGRPLYIQRRKARALLAYLAVTQQTVSRETLVALLWPEYDNRSGRADLSRILSTLRNRLGPDFFLTNRESVAVNLEVDLWVDVLRFRQQVDACREADIAGLNDDHRQKLMAAIELYQADFLAGFTLPDSPAFDEWQLLHTEALRRDLSWALDKLIYIYESHNDLALAIPFAQRWVGVDPLHEPAQRRLIALYAYNGQRAEAHRQYQACVRLLEEQLGVEPQSETKLLYELIRKTGSIAPSVGNRFEFVSEEDNLPGQGAIGEVYRGPDAKLDPYKQHHPFVGRARELAQLNNYLDEAMAANGRVIFVTGGAGRGKTSLLEEFALQAQKTNADLIVAAGNGNSVAGVGDPYLPFREVMGMLTGDLTMQRTGGQMSDEQRRRLWALIPISTQSILEHGTQLLDVFVSGKQLLARAANSALAGAGWLRALQRQLSQRENATGALEQTALFEQFTNVLHDLSNKRPLLITLDDLQWIDEASVGLLFHLGRRLTGSRVLIVGAYRPDELLQGQNGEPHPLDQILDEFKRIYGNVFIDLACADQDEGRDFIEAILDIEPNRLDKPFRQALFQQTGGHPLFTIELLRHMQLQGNLIKDEEGQWCEGPDLDWETLPARVEAVIERRIGRLEEASRVILGVASVEGEIFTAEVVAQAIGLEERSLLHNLSHHLEVRHRLVRERGEIKAGKGYLSSYQFNHALFQQYLYRQLSHGERRRLHGAVAEALAALYADNPDQVVVQLAYHYTAAANWQRAVRYQSRAGDLAYQKATLPDAARYYQSALAHWPDSDEVGKAQVSRKLGECLWVLGKQLEAVEMLQSSYTLSHRARDFQGAGATQRLLGRVYWELGQPDKAGDCYRQAQSILEREPESKELAWTLAGLSNYYMHLGDYDKSIKLGEQSLALARSLNADEIIIQCLCDLGSALSSKGDWEGVALEQESLARALALNRPHDAGRAYLYIGEAFIYLGSYDRARETLEEALTYTRRMQVLYIAEAAERMLADLDWLTGRWSTAIHRLQQIDDQSYKTQPGSIPQLYLGIVLGRLYNDLGQPERARNLLVDMLAVPINTLDPRAALVGELARAEAVLGRPEAVASAATEILEWTDQTPYLFPNVGMPLLLICRLPVAFHWPAMVGFARSAWHQLERLYRQFRTPVTEAYLLEGQGWLSLAEAEKDTAAGSLEQAALQWQVLGQPYDHARALSGLGLALIKAGDMDGAILATKEALGLVESLAAQLEDPTLKSSFLDSVLVQQIHTMMA